MADTIVKGEVAKIYVEAPQHEAGDDLGHESASKVTALTEMMEDRERDNQFVRAWYSPSKVVKQTAVLEASSQPSVAQVVGIHRTGHENQSEGLPHEDSNDSDSDYLPDDEASSGEDEEAIEIFTKFNQFRTKLKAGEAANLDDVVLEGPKKVPTMYEIEDDGNATSYEDSSGEEDSVEELGDSEVVTKTSNYPRYNKKNPTPQFEIGMKFSGKRQFKKAVTKHGLLERRFIRFLKNEGDRIIAKCDWATCQWRCMASVNSRCSSWQIASLNDDHTCPPRRDNRLVTAARIAEKYEKMIIANPTWSIEAMKTTVQEEMFADVHGSKLKRAKSIVMQRALDATKGQYKLMYNYQLELLRSNPGSTVVKKDTDATDPVFQRMYICLDALRKGFLAGCRKVVGLDGCFFKGATNGELL
jgi:alpha-galactosidase